METENKKRKIDDESFVREFELQEIDNTYDDGKKRWFYRFCVCTILFILEQLKEEVLWLKVRNEPWSEVILKWQNTFPSRKRSTHSTVEFFF